MLQKQKPINTMLAISHHFKNKKIEKAKKYLQDNYKSTLSHGSHITIVDSPQEEINTHKLLIDLEDLFKKTPPIKIQTGDIVIGNKSNFFHMPITSPDLIKFHYDIEKIANIYRGNLIRQKDVVRLERDPSYYDKKQLDMIREFGSPLAGDNYVPHITIGTAKEAEEAELYIIKSKLTKILENVLYTEMTINSLDVLFFKDSENQTEQIEYWRKKYSLYM